MNLRKLFSSTTHYNRADELKKRGLTDSSLRSRKLSPQAEKYEKAMNRAMRKGGSNGVGVGY